MPKPLRILLYPLVAAVSFVVFLVVQFPFDAVRGRVAAELERGLGGKYSVTIGSLAPRWFGADLRLKDVAIQSKALAGEGAATRIQRADLDIGLFALLGGALKIGFELRAAHSQVSGFVSLERSGYHLDLKMKEFDLADWQALWAPWGVTAEGQLKGEVAFEMYPIEPLRNKAQVAVDVVRLKSGVFPIKAVGFDLPAISWAEPDGGSRIALNMERGNIEVEAVTLNGSDVQLSSTGKVYTARELSNFRLNLRGQFKLSDPFSQAVPVMVLIEKQKDEQGAFPFTVTGRVAKPSIRIGDFKLPI